jgi:hypothetical protein
LQNSSWDDNVAEWVALTAGMIPVLFQQWQAETVKKIHDTHTELCLTSIRKDLKLSADMTNDELLSALTN